MDKHSRYIQRRRQGLRIKVVAAIILLTVFVGIVFGSDTRSNSSGAGLILQTDDAAAIFKNRCTRCHMADGTGKEAYTPDFTDAKWQSTRKDEELTNAITDGQDDMPAFGDILNKDQIKGLVTYVRSFAKKSERHVYEWSANQ